MATFFVWIESQCAPPPACEKSVTFGVERLPAGPTARLENLPIGDAMTARRCELLHQQRGIQVSVQGEHSVQLVVDKALVKVEDRQRSWRDIEIRNTYQAVV